MAIPKFPKNGKVVIMLAVIIFLVSSGCYAYLKTADGDKNVHASGTVEVTEVQLTPQAGGRIIRLEIDESDVVKKGDLIARMSMDGADNDVSMAADSLAAARQQLNELQNGYRKEDVAKAEAEVGLRKTLYDQAAKDENRFVRLSADGVVSAREAELYSENANARQDELRIAQQQLTLLHNGSREEQIKAAQANVKRAAEALKKAKTLAAYKEFYSPADGTILTKNYEVGDVIAAGAPIATLGKMNDCWVKLYIPSTQLGLIKLGGLAEVQVDAYPDRVFHGKVSEVNQKAEYNPRLSLTQKERSNMVFWIKISIDNPDGVLKPGMPADVVVL